MPLKILLLTLLTLISSCSKDTEVKSKKELSDYKPLEQTPSKKDALPLGCPKEMISVNYNFGKIHTFKDNSELWICGFGSMSQFRGEIFHTTLDSKDIIRVGYFGGAREVWGPLSVDYVKIELGATDFKVTQLVPYREGKYIDSTMRVYVCSNKLSGCNRKEETICRWRGVDLSPSENTIHRINDFLVGSSEDLPTNDDILNTYFDALDGSKDSIDFFIKNDKVPSRIEAEATGYSGHVGTFGTLKNYLDDLFQNCSPRS